MALTRMITRTASVVPTSFVNIRRLHERYERHRWKNNSNSYNYFPVLAATALAGGGAFVLFKNRHSVNCEDKEHLAFSEDAGDDVAHESKHLSFNEAVIHSDALLQRVKLESASPGLVVSVSVDGKQLWSKGYGLADVENAVPCSPSTVMRIASISKPLTMVAVARLWEDGKLDLDESIQYYVPSWPDKSFDGKKVTITTRQLVSMMAGIRHYDKKCQKEETSPNSKKSLKEKEMKSAKPKNEFDNKEYYIKEFYKSVDASLELFKHDELCSMPGTEFLYSTYTWNLVSAVVEGASGGKKFGDIMKTLFYDLGLENTYLDENLPIIHNRARNYVINKESRRLMNARYVDNSYKWAGGGFLSTAPDLCHFGNIMLYSYQWSKLEDHQTAAGYLKPETVRMLWTPVKGTRLSWDRDGSYAMGWGVVSAADADVGPGRSKNRRQYVGHTGGAVGASSALVILPRKTDNVASCKDGLPCGVVVAIIVNMESVSLNKTALKIAKLFENVHS